MLIHCPVCKRLLEVAPDKKDMIEHIIGCESRGNGPQNGGYPIDAEFGMVMAKHANQFSETQIKAIKAAHNHVKKKAGLKEVA